MCREILLIVGATRTAFPQARELHVLLHTVGTSSAMQHRHEGRGLTAIDRWSRNEVVQVECMTRSTRMA